MAKRGKKVNQESISLTEYPSIHYKKFFDRFPEIESVAVNDWEGVHVIAYFCKKYEDYYGLKYSFKFNSTAPTKSYEVFQIRKLASMLSASPNILKDYIDWFFTNKIISRKRRITSMAFMTDTITVNEYKFKKLGINKNISIDRSTTLPPNYIEVITGFGQNISNYGELAFVKRCMDNGNATDPKFREMMDALRKAGLDTNSLDRVK
jgi:hypothetical protein